jgi:hypothetical protein
LEELAGGATGEVEADAEDEDEDNREFREKFHANVLSEVMGM